MNFFPLCTASVWPTISGTTVDRRDHVLMTFFSAPRFITSTFSRRCVSTKGPFFSERPIVFSNRPSLSPIPPAPDHYFGRRCTMNFCVDFRFRVLYPLVGIPHGETGCRPPEVLPSPP